jgi:hypothetical protein
MTGIGTAVVDALSALISVLLGTLIGQSDNGTILPLVQLGANKPPIQAAV